MTTIVLQQSKRVIRQIKVCENSTLGTWGSHQLLLNEYRLQQDEDEHWSQAIFNYKWLKDMELGYGPLWCVYCGKEELKIYHFHDKKTLSNMATADHFIPISTAPHLAKERKNLRVCCWKCNNKKADKEWKENFPYD